MLMVDPQFEDSTSIHVLRKIPSDQQSWPQCLRASVLKKTAIHHKTYFAGMYWTATNVPIISNTPRMLSCAVRFPRNAGLIGECNTSA